MSLVITTLLVAGGALAGRWLMKSLKPKPPVPVDDAAPREVEAPVVPVATRDLFASFPCRLGDVVIRAGAEEAWLAGALVFSEDAVVAAMFVAPEAGRDRGVYVRRQPADTMIWMDPLAPDEITTGQEPPTSVEHEGVRFERTRRLPVHVERVGTGAPDVGERAILAEYAAAAGERIIVVVGAAPARAWRGAALEPGMYEVLPGAKTLE